MPVVQRLMTAPGVGPDHRADVSRAVLDDVERGLATTRSVRGVSSGWCRAKTARATRQRKGGITKAGPTVLRALLVQASVDDLAPRRRRRGALHAWVERLAARRGRRIAVVALARRLGRILYAMWRDGQ